MAAHLETGTMAPPLQYQSYTLDHLGVVAGMCDELGIAELIDRVIVQDRDKRTVSVGTGVKAMILNGLGFVNRALYLTPPSSRASRWTGCWVRGFRRRTSTMMCWAGIWMPCTSTG